MKILHSASLGLVDRCNVIVLLGISANQIDSEDSGGRRKFGCEMCKARSCLVLH